jgi:large subunit ribosomal protein L9
MKVILLQELKGRGGEGDVIEVARGFAVNYLLPRKVAIEATSGNLKQLEQRRHNIEKREASRLTDAESLRVALDGKSVTISAKVGEEGRLFGSVTSPMVEEAIREQLGVGVDRRKIETHGHIKEVGPHVVDVSVYRDVKAQVTVEVIAEGAPIPETVVVETEGITEEGDAFVGLEEQPAEVEEPEAEPAEEPAAAAEEAPAE